MGVGQFHGVGGSNSAGLGTGSASGASVLPVAVNWDCCKTGCYRRTDRAGICLDSGPVALTRVIHLAGFRFILGTGTC